MIVIKESKPYKFNDKELDEASGLYYYGARYYNPRLSIWYGVDPLAEKMPSWSPYAYAFDNPVRFVDPDGRMPTDDYRLNRDGSLSLLKRTNDKFDRIYNSEGSGHIIINKNIIDNRYDGNYIVRRGDDKINKYVSIYHSVDETSMKKFFNFIKDNVNTEFSLAGYANAETGAGKIFVIATEYQKSQEGVGSYFAWKVLRNKHIALTEFTHLHPKGTLVPSGFDGHGAPDNGDRGNRKFYENDFYKGRIPDQFNIVVPNSHKKVNYDSEKYNVK